MVVVKGQINTERIKKVAITIAKELQQRGQKNGI
jgi:hypothetical protein